VTPVRVAVPLGDLRPGEGRLLLAGDRRVALFLTEAGPRAIDAACPHAGGPLHDGILSGTRVVCPLHLRRVDLDTGEVDDCAERVRCYPARLTGGEVVLDL
jgi:nitrite reductase (NADH) small subunit